MKKFLLLIASSGLALFCGVLPAHAAFTYYRSVTATTSATAIPGTLSNFPALVDVTLTSLKTTGNGGHVQNANGYDIGFGTEDTCSTGKINYERENYVATTGELEAWLPVTSLSTSTVLYMCYGDASVSTDPSSSTAPWAPDGNYTMVAHLDESGSTFNDSSGNGNGSTASAGTTQIAGPFGKAQSLSGSGSYITVPQINYGPPNNFGPYTMEEWVNTPDTTSYSSVIDCRTSGGNGQILYSNISDGIAQYYSNPTNVIAAGTVNVQDGNWHMLAGSFEGTTLNVYTDGGDNHAVTNNASVYVTSCHIGEDYANTSYAGDYAEIRFSNVIRSANWIASDYWTGHAIGTNGFWTVGSEQGGGGGGVASIFNNIIKIIEMDW